MKMKKVLAAVLCLAMVFSMAGCSLFTSSDDSSGSTASELKINDEYTHKDPEDLEYETRYAYYSGDSCVLVDMFQEYYDVTPTAEYIIIYANKDDVAVAQYTYILMETEEDAEKFSQVVDNQGVPVQVFGTVTLQQMNEQELADTIDSFIAMNVLTDTSAKTYAEMQRDMDLLVEYIPE